MDDFNVILYFQISHDPDLKWTEARLKSGGRLLTGELTIKPLQPRGGRVDNLKAAIIRMSITVVLSSNWGSTSGEEAGLSGRVDGGFKNVALDLTWTRKKGSCLLCCPASENNVAPALEWKVRMRWHWGWDQGRKPDTLPARLQQPPGQKGIVTVRPLPEGVMMIFMPFEFCVPVSLFFFLSWY